MTVFYFIAGALVGGSIASISHNALGIVAGGALGILLVMISTLRTRIDNLQEELRMMKRNSSTVAPEECDVKPRGHAPDTNPHPLKFKPEASVKTDELLTDAGSYRESAQDDNDFFTSRETGPSRDDTPSPVVEAITRFITGGNFMVKIGVIILFFGVSFLVKFAAERGMIPIEFRLAAVTLGAIVLLVVGWRLREGRAQYALVLQGGGVGILYLTIFAAFRLYALIPAPLAFALLVAICVLSSALAIIQDSRTLVVLGVSGGFLAPILASTGNGSHIVLFSYYALLNAGIVGVAWFRAWRELNLVGFAFTFVIGASWGGRYYKPEYFTTIEPFLILFFLMYSLVAVLFAIRQKPDLKGYVDGTLVFGTPVVAAAFQASLVSGFEFGLAWSALGMGLYYIALAKWLISRNSRDLRLLSESFLAFGVVFATIAIPLALDGRWTAAAWALEGGAMVWAGIRQERWVVRVFGLVLLVGGGVFFLADLPSKGTIACLNGFWLGVILISGASLLASFLLTHNRQTLNSWELPIADLLLVWGLVWWYFGGFLELSRWLEETRIMAALVFVALSSAICDYVAERLKWDALILPSFLILPVICLAFPIHSQSAAHPFAGGGFLAWPVALLLYYRILKRRGVVAGKFLPFIHPVPVWSAAILLAWELHWWVGQISGIARIWPLLPIGLVPALLILLLSVLVDRVQWPFVAHRRTYLLIGSVPLAAGAWGWNIVMNLSYDGNAAPIPFIPILNPLDLAEGIITVIVVMWARQRLHEEPETIREQAPMLLVLFFGTLFLWLNALIARTVHHWGGVAFSFDAMFASFLFQSAISLVWSITAFCSMTFATRKGMRIVWFVGAAILATVVLKLFLVELAGKGTVERIVSFVGVGVLMLVIGWFSPVPPRAGMEAHK